MSNFKFSENKIFAVDSTDEEFLYIHKDFVKEASEFNPFIFKYFNIVRQSSRTAKLPDYIKFNNIINFKNLDNDCLLLAEGIISKDLSAPDYKTSKLRVLENKSRLFGHSDAQNMLIANDIDKYTTEDQYNHINPNIMQAYAMLPIILPEDVETCPYHAAAVILKDGNSNITLEADSGLGNLRKPVFDIYSVVDPDLSFYQRYKTMYTVNKYAPACAILTSRDQKLIKKKSTKTLKKSSSKSPKKSSSKSPKKSSSKSPKKSSSKSPKKSSSKSPEKV